MAGNVAEWTFSASGDDRLVLGDSASDAKYAFYHRKLRFTLGSNSYDRFNFATATTNSATITGPELTRILHERYRRWHGEAEAIINFIEDPPEFDGVGYLGMSYGSIGAVPILGLLAEIQAAILLAGGHTLSDPLDAAH